MASVIPDNQASFSHAELIAATSGSCPPFEGTTRGVGTDSRAALPGGLFVALPGERFDGHDFVATAVRQGARVVVLERDAPGAAGASVLRVPSTLRALGDLARYHRRRWGRRIVGVAGSVGKTTTRSSIAAVAAAAGLRVHSPRGNLNNLVGVPLVLLGLTEQHDLGVVELGTNQTGEIARLSEISQPDLAVLTRIALEHSEGLGDLDAIEVEEGTVLRTLGPAGVAVLNADDERCSRQAESCPRARQVRYGLLAGAGRTGATYRIVKHESASPQRTRVRLERPAGVPLELDSPLLGLPGAYALAAALAVTETLLGRALGEAEVASALASPVLGEPGRLTVVELPDGSLVLDDTYNSSPASVRSSAAVARDLARQRQARLVLVLGEMRELGPLSEAAHRELGADLAQLRPELLIAFGGDAVHLLSGRPPRSHFAADALGALALLESERRPGDVILVKASRGLRAERVVQGLRAAGGQRRVIYELLYPMSTRFGWASMLNVLRYVPFRIIMATLTAMLLCFFLAPWFIRQLQSKQIGQVIRADGPASHHIKAGTPTMGGALILLALLVSTMLWVDVHNVFVMATAGVTAGYGLIGYLDDHLKIVARHSRGLPGRYKILGQVGVGGAALVYTFVDFGQLPDSWLLIRTRLSIPFLAFSKHPIELPLWLYLAFALFVLVAFSNAVNLTDGLDGLAIGPVMINAGTYLVWSYVAGLVLFGRPLAQYLDIAGTPEMGELAVFAAATIGAGIGFLWYNTYPAQVFMGDVGSLALGGGLGMLALLTKNELLSVLVGGIFVLESVSVVTQVISFKLFGKRVFLMAPIHHHFEKKGWAEPKIIVRFWIISILLALIGLSSLKLR